MRTRTAVALLAFTLAAVLAVPAAGAAPARADRTACAAVVSEFRRQGASPAVAARFGAIAWRESGCVAQYVRDWDDLSYSRLGLNFRGRMPRYWRSLCGVSDFHATAVLSTDVRCALAAYRRMGWRPWR